MESTELLQILKKLISKSTKIANKAGEEFRLKIINEDPKNENFILKQYLKISPNCAEIFQYLETIEEVCCSFLSFFLKNYFLLKDDFRRL